MVSESQCSCHTPRYKDYMFKTTPLCSRPLHYVFWWNYIPAFTYWNIYFKRKKDNEIYIALLYIIFPLLLPYIQLGHYIGFEGNYVCRQILLSMHFSSEQWRRYFKMYIIKMECYVQKVCEPLRQGKKTNRTIQTLGWEWRGFCWWRKVSSRHLVNSGAVMRRPLVSGFLVVTNMIQDRNLIHFFI